MRSSRWASLRDEVGLTISIDDIVTTPEKAAILEKSRSRPPRLRRTTVAASLSTTSVASRRSRSGPTPTRRSVTPPTVAMNAILDNPIRQMVDSGARGNSQQIRQIAAMKGLVSIRVVR